MTRKRLEDELQNEIGLRRQAGEGLLERGMLVEAGREFRLLLELDPKAESIRVKLKTIDEKLAHKRTLVNDIRTLIAGLKFEEAIAMWDKAPPDLREEALGKQVEHLRSVTVPSLKLCDQGDLYNEQGRVEEAVSAFQDALRIDENCERARHGLSDAEQKLHRIDTMLKEGYELALRQEYKEAIDTLRPILTMYPNHPRAVKSIVDACQAIAQDRRQNGDLKSALKAYAQAHEVDPQNRSIAKLYDEMTDLHDKEAALLDRAAQATARGNPGEAISYWQDILRINPANTEAAKALMQLKSQRGRRSVKLVVVLVVLAALAWVGYQGVSEFLIYHEATSQREARNYDKALELLEGRVFYFYKEEVPELQRICKRDAYEQKADTLYEAGGDVKAVLEYYDMAIRACTPEEETLKAQYELKKVLVEAGHQMAEGEKSITAEAWEEAVKAFSLAYNIADKLRKVPEAQKLAEKANYSKLFGNYCLAATKAETQEEALKHLLPAQDLRPDNEWVKKQLEKRGYDPNKFKNALGEAVSLLDKPYDPENAKKAVELIKKAQGSGLNNERAITLLNFALDAEFCAENGMVLVNHYDPKNEAMKWTNRERRLAFCVDRFEYVEKDAKLPKVNVSWVEARQICLDAGKDLCSFAHWQEACKAKSLGAIYPFGEEAKGDECNWQSEGPEAPGSRPKCVNTIGAYDMSGNVAEWTRPNDMPDGEKAPAQANIGGGHFKSGPKDATCWSDVTASAAGKKPEIGFRCCKILPGLPKQ
ncbi:MAG: SUMF1/EgtB/PvdO family nonheme iron enzyme [Planctomycetaceae bacterium]|nr:SUMF1/EgtB/PvdO family nonheme iron enzyme [Planctomycetaceae bacterium]